MKNEEQDERIPLSYELELASEVAGQLLDQYPHADDGSEDRLETWAAVIIKNLVFRLVEKSEEDHAQKNSHSNS